MKVKTSFVVTVITLFVIVFGFFQSVSSSSYRISYENQAYSRCLPYAFYLTNMTRPNVDAIERGDLIVVTSKGYESYFGDRNLMKLVLGLPGDTVEHRAGKVFINNSYIAELPPAVPFEEYDVKSYQIPNGHFWLGGSTTTTVDSRYIGPFKTGQIIGTSHAII